MQPQTSSLELLAPPAPAASRPRALTVVRREVELIVNAHASGAADVAAKALDALSAAGARPRLHVTADEGELESVVRRAEGRRIVLVAAGRRRG